jgi:hypothetical protein
MRTPHPIPLPRETVSQYEKTDFLERGKGGQVGGLPGSGLSKDNETLPKDLDLPARSRSGEGRAVTFGRSDSALPGR